MKRVIQIPSVGRHGRFSNWLIHYLVGRYYAAHFGATVETPSWIGNVLFELNDPEIKHEKHFIGGNTYLKPFRGTIALPPFYFIPKELYSRCLNRDFVQRTLKWRPEFLSPHIPSVDCAVHIRRGDYAHLIDFPWVEMPDIEKALKDCGEDIGSVEFVKEDDPHRIGIYPYGFEHIEDFQILMKAKRLYVYPRSTFSQLAALLGNGDVYMPYGWTGGKSKVKYRKADCENPIIFSAVV